jgi:hypothetical protein
MAVRPVPAGRARLGPTSSDARAMGCGVSRPEGTHLLTATLQSGSGKQQVSFAGQPSETAILPGRSPMSSTDSLEPGMGSRGYKTPVVGAAGAGQAGEGLVRTFTNYEESAVKAAVLGRHEVDMERAALTVWVGNIPAHFAERDKLLQLFDSCGVPLNCKIRRKAPRDPLSGERSEGCACPPRLYPYPLVCIAAGRVGISHVVTLS